MDRSERRHHKKRMKNKARRIAKINHSYLQTTNPDLLDKYQENYEIIADNLKECQHYGCGNVRRNPYEKKKQTKQERIKNDLDEYGDYY